MAALDTADRPAESADAPALDLDRLAKLLTSLAAHDEQIRRSTMARCDTTGRPFYGPRAQLVERGPGSATFRCPSCLGEHQVDRDGTRTGYSLILRAL